MPSMSTLFSLKGMCAFKEECGTPSPCLPIKGGEPHFLVFTIWGRNSCSSLPHTPSFPVLHHVFVSVRLSLPVCLRVRGARAPRLLGVRVLVLGARLFRHSSSSSSLVHVLTSSVFATRLPLPPLSHKIISSFFCPPYSCPSLRFARVSTIVIS